MKKLLYILLAISIFTACQRYESYTDVIRINGQNIFYAAEGKGKPVILLHSNGGSHNDLETMQRQLAQAGYMVYALDSRGQGCNSPLQEYHYADMAEDVLAFIDSKGLEQPAIYGWSDGGIVALTLESTHPGTCSLIAACGANITAEGSIDPDLFSEIFGPDDMTDSLPPLVRMMRMEPNMSHEDLQRIKIPVLVCAGENDMILPEHTRLIASLLPDAELCIIPDADHGSYIYHNPTMGTLLLDFLKKHGY